VHIKVASQKELADQLSQYLYELNPAASSDERGGTLHLVIADVKESSGLASPTTIAAHGTQKEIYAQVIKQLTLKNYFKPEASFNGELYLVPDNAYETFITTCGNSKKNDAAIVVNTPLFDDKRFTFMLNLPYKTSMDATLANYFVTENSSTTLKPRTVPSLTTTLSQGGLKIMCNVKDTADAFDVMILPKAPYEASSFTKPNYSLQKTRCYTMQVLGLQLDGKMFPTFAAAVKRMKEYDRICVDSVGAMLIYKLGKAQYAVIANLGQSEDLLKFKIKKMNGFYSVKGRGKIVNPSIININCHLPGQPLKNVVAKEGEYFQFGEDSNLPDTYDVNCPLCK
jgi:hypothetical protein